MSYSHTLQVYSNHDFEKSYISDETAANIRGYMNDNDFFDYLEGPLYFPTKNGVWMSIWFSDEYKNKVMDFGANADVDFSMEADIREMSYLFPDLIFELTVHCVNVDGYTKFYYKNGKVKTAPGEIEVRYTDFDDLEWRDAK